jgi:AcrR family transcriptional regulator
MSPTTTTRKPRRLPPAARRDQLERIAMSVAAQRGFTGISLEEVAERAGVTRGLLYHYFPRGRLDVFLAAVDRAGRELTEGWVTDDRLPLDQRVAPNLQRFVEHALKPSDAWRVHRLGKVAGEPEVDRLADRYRAVVISSMALNQFGTPDPSPLAALALRSFVAFAETALDECREGGLDPETVTALIARTLAATVEAVRTADGWSPVRDR